MNPTSGLAQALTDAGGLALQQVHLALDLKLLSRARDRARLGQTRAELRGVTDAPGVLPGFDGLVRLASEVFTHVHTDTASTDDGHLVAGLLRTREQLVVTNDLLVVDTGNARDARGDTRGHNHVVKLGLELVDVGTRAQVNWNFEHLQATGEVLQRLAVVLLARNLCGEIELATNLVGGLEDLRVVTPLSCGFRESESSHTSADDGDALGLVLRHRHGYQLGFVSRLWVDQTGGALGREGVVQAGLVTGDTGVDLVSATIARLDGEVRVSQQRAGHGNQVRIAVSEDLLRNLGAIDSVGGCHRDVDKRTETTRQIRECGARHGRNDGGDACFVPADTRVEDIDASLDQALSEFSGLGPGLTVFHQVK